MKEVRRVGLIEPKHRIPSPKKSKVPSVEERVKIIEDRLDRLESQMNRWQVHDSEEAERMLKNVIARFQSPNGADKECKASCVPVEQKSGRIEELTKPLIEYLRSSCHPYTSIVVTQERVAVIETVQSIPKDCIIEWIREVSKGESRFKKGRF